MVEKEEDRNKKRKTEKKKMREEMIGRWKKYFSDSAKLTHVLRGKRALKKFFKSNSAKYNDDKDEKKMHKARYKGGGME